MIWALVVFAPFALLGHMAAWVSAWNYTHSSSMSLPTLKTLNRLAKACLLFIPPVIAIVLAITTSSGSTYWSSVVYVSLATLVGIIGVPLVYLSRRRRNVTTKLREFISTVRNCEESRKESFATAGLRSRVCFAIPGNQSFEFEQNEKQVEIPRLDRELDGVTIAHLSDLHFTGEIAKSYFDQAIDAINEMDADIIAVTGDLIDEKEYMSWIPATLGRLKARHGTYVVFGNHDCKQNLSLLRLILSESGLTYLGGRIKQLKIRGTNIVLAGNELPWVVPAAEMAECPSRDNQSHLRILLAHTPDQFSWAQHFDFDLMLAGHTHGGQFCIPGFGPFVCPSRMPAEYTSGTVYKAPTLLHTSRGLSGQLPLRLNCRPEITKLVLRCPQNVMDKAEIDGQSVVHELNEIVHEAQRVQCTQEAVKLHI